MTVTLTFKDLLHIAAVAALLVAFLFAAAWVAPLPSEGVGAAFVDALTGAARLAPFLVAWTMLTVPRWSGIVRAFGRLPLTRVGAAAAWVVAAIEAQIASWLAHAGAFGPSIMFLVLAISVGGCGLMLLLAERKAREPAATSPTA